MGAEFVLPVAHIIDCTVAVQIEDAVPVPVDIFNNVYNITIQIIPDA